MTTPRLGAPELVLSQDVPETTVNEQIRFVEQGANRFIVLDKDLATPPGSPADGAAYIVASSPTGAWTGWTNRVAFYKSGWEDIVPIEGTRAYVQDENAEYEYDGAAWGAPSTSASSGIDIEDEGVSEATGVTILNFTGSGVTATDVGGGQVDVNISGSGGGGYEAGPATPPTSGGFTWDNQGTSTVTDGTDTLILKPQVNGVIHGMYTTAPATPYNIYCRVDINCLSTAAVTNGFTASAGILLKDTGGDNERLSLGIYFERQSGGDESINYAAMIQRWTGASPPVFSATATVKYGGVPWQWVRVHNDGTTLTLYVSRDGKNWISVGTETLAAFIDGAASYGFYAYANADATECAAMFTYFSTTAPS